MERRKFLARIGCLGAPLIGGCQRSPSSQSPKRFVIDANDISKETRAELEIVHELPAVDVIVGYIEPDYLEDVASYQDGSSRFRPGSGSKSVTAGFSHETDLYELQWDKRSQSVRTVHRITRGEGSSVAIVGTGVIETHPDLASALTVDRSRNVTEDAADHEPIGGRTHGTHIAGIIAASDRNGGVTGIAPGAELVDYRIVSADGVRVGDLLAALTYAVEDGCDVVNLSRNWYPYTPGSDRDFLITALQRIAAYAEDEGTVLVCSAGNDAAHLSPTTPPFSLPSNLETTVTVSATAPSGYGWPVGSDAEYVGEYPIDGNATPAEPPHTPTDYTNYGTNVLTVSAPGGAIDEDRLEHHPEARYDGILSTTFSLELNGSTERHVPDYGWEVGTSFAAPQVAGSLALLKSEYPELSPAEVRSHLRRTARDVSPAEYRGAGHLDSAALVRTEPSRSG